MLWRQWHGLGNYTNNWKEGQKSKRKLGKESNSVTNKGKLGKKGMMYKLRESYANCKESNDVQIKGKLGKESNGMTN